MTVDKMISDCRKARVDLTNAINELHRLKEEFTKLGVDLTLAKKGEMVNGKLSRALAHFYPSTDKERQDFDDHCYWISAAGGVPPNRELHWATVALKHWEGIHATS